MASIDDLKKNNSPVTISIGSPTAKSIKKAIEHDENSDRVIVNSREQLRSTPNNSNENTRVVVDSSELQSAPNPLDSLVEVRESKVKDILDLDNPDSLFSQYVNRKEKEMDEYLQKLDKAQELAENDFIDEDGVNTADDGAVIGIESIASDRDDNSYSMPIESRSEEFLEEMNNDEIEKQLSAKIEKDDEPVSIKIGSEVEDDTPFTRPNTNTDDTINVSINTNNSRPPIVDKEVVPESNIIEKPREDKNAPKQTDPEAVDMDAELQKIDTEVVEKDNKEDVQKKKELEKKESEELKQEIEELDLETGSATTEFKQLDDQGEEIADEEEDQVDVSNEETLKELQKLATEKLRPISKSLDIKSFSRAKKPTANLKILKNNQARVKAAKWVLPEQESIVMMKEFLGSELEELRNNSTRSDNLTQLNRRYRMIYDHIVSAKPDSYDTWLKTTPFADVDHYFFAAYIASFKGTNFLPMTCSNNKCQKIHLTDDIPILDMVKFKDDNARNKFLALYRSTKEKANDLYLTEIVPLSDTIAIGFKEASIYSLFEIASLDVRFREKFSAILDYFPYIDAVYIIDRDSQQLIPIGHKLYPDNAEKTTKSKIVMINKALETLSIDQFGPIKAYVSALISKRSEVGFNYIIPEFTCPNCGTKIEEQEVSGEELVFTRYQLGALTSTSIN